MVSVQRRDLFTEIGVLKRKMRLRQRAKTASCIPKAWKRPIPHSPRKIPTLTPPSFGALSFQNWGTINACCLKHRSIDYNKNRADCKFSGICPTLRFLSCGVYSGHCFSRGSLQGEQFPCIFQNNVMKSLMDEVSCCKKIHSAFKIFQKRKPQIRGPDQFSHTSFALKCVA